MQIKKYIYKKELKYIEEKAYLNGFNIKTIHKLNTRHKVKQNKIITLSKIKNDNIQLHEQWINKTLKHILKNR